MKRFYQSAAVGWNSSTFGVLLDGKSAKTPLGRILALPSFAVAQAIRDEFSAQTDIFNPASMPVMQLACTIEDQVSPRADEIRQEILSYAAGDAICYWAGQPEDLRAREKQVWGATLEKLRQMNMNFHVCLGLNRVPQPQDSLEALQSRLQLLDDWRLGLLHLNMALTGSALAAYLWSGGGMDADELFACGFLPEIYRCQQAGENAKLSPHLKPYWDDIQIYHRVLCALEADADYIEAKAIISGRVQGVGYRDWCQRMAENLGLSGFVRNKSDGTVECQILGSKQQIHAMLDAMSKGPKLAAVSHVTISVYAPSQPPVAAEFIRKPTA